MCIGNQANQVKPQAYAFLASAVLSARELLEPAVEVFIEAPSKCTFNRECNTWTIQMRLFTRRYASASFAPNQANGCGAIYEAIVYWPQKCDAVATKQFAQFKRGRSLQKDILVLESETPARIFLMPAGSGCLSIKKEVVL